jgi:GT2 family glycosyltransferase
VAAGESGNEPPVRFVKLIANAGFARANNIALRRVIDEERDEHVLLLNPDTEVLPGALKAMAEVLADPAVGIVGPQLLNPDGTRQPSVRAFPTLAVFVFFFLKLHYVLAASPLWRRYMSEDLAATRQQPVDQVMGAALLARNEMIGKIGPLDERFWIWFEEVDWCKRAREAGWKVMYEPRASIVHRGAVSFSHLRGMRKTRLWTMSSIRYARKHLGAGAALVLILLLPIALLLAVPATVLRKI